MSGCAPTGDAGCCEVEAVLSVDERGQMVLPKALRAKLGIEAGDRLAAVTMQRDGEVCCVTLVKVDAIAPMVRDFLGPVMSEVFDTGGE
jgi:AbrB family looped-hinge helix DNA binding protein